MSKMKEWAYTVERIELLFRYLELLERMQSYYVMNDRVNRVCEEIEKELELGEGNRIQESYNKAVEANGEALELLSDSKD